MRGVTGKNIRTEFVIGGFILSIVSMVLVLMQSIGPADVLIIGWVALFTNLIIGFIIISNERILEEMREEDG